jgi:hypothetical protein
LALQPNSDSTLEFYPPPDKRQRPDIPRVSVTKAPDGRGSVSLDKTKALHDAIALTNLVSQSNLRASVETLAGFSTRHTLSRDFHQVTNWVVQQFRGLGYDDVALHSYKRDGASPNNVICVKPSSGGGSETVILCAHYDCIMQRHNDATAQAPGANDNATGVAVILEAARIFAQTDLKHTIRFVCFSGEEQGLWGSTAYAAHVRREGLDVKFVLNLDQVGFPAASREIIIEQDLGNTVAGNDQASQALANTLAQAVSDQLNIPVKLGPIYDSDYMPFEARGYVVIGLYESGENYPGYHSDQDTPDKVDYDYLVDVAKSTVTAIST